MAKSDEQLDWLIIFLVYNNDYYDMKQQDTSDYYTMKEQTKYIRNQIRYSNHNANVKTVFVEAKIDNCANKPSATLSILQKNHDRWLSAVNRIWRDADRPDIFTTDVSLQTILQNLKKEFDAKKHMVITVGHGSIVGINYYIPDLKIVSSRAPKLENFFKEKQFFIDDEEKAESLISYQYNKQLDIQAGKLLFLSNQEISEAIKNVFTKVDVLVMYNCIMQNVFTQYEFRDCTEWFVAPLSGISIPGFNYIAVLNEISKNPGAITNEAISKLFIDTIRVGNNYKKYKEDIEGTWKIAASKINSSLQEEICGKFSDLFEQINKMDNEKLIGCIYETGRFSFNYSNYCLSTIRIVDIGIFLSYLKDKISREYQSLKNLIPYIDDLQSKVQLLKKDSYVFEGKDFYKVNGELNYIEHRPEFKNMIVNMGLFLAITGFESDILDYIYTESNYNNTTGINDINVPRFLKNYNYGSVLKKLRELPS